MPNLTDKRRAVLLQVSDFLRHVAIKNDRDVVTALELAALTAKLSLPDNGAAEIREPISEDVCVTRGGVSVIAPASTPADVLVALFDIAKAVDGLPEMTLRDIVAHVRGMAGPGTGGYRDHSVALHQVDAALRGDSEQPTTPYPDGADASQVVYRAGVAIESMRETATALGKISARWVVGPWPGDA